MSLRTLRRRRVVRAPKVLLPLLAMAQDQKDAQGPQVAAMDPRKLLGEPPIFAMDQRKLLGEHLLPPKAPGSAMRRNLCLVRQHLRMAPQSRDASAGARV